MKNFVNSFIIIPGLLIILFTSCSESELDAPAPAVKPENARRASSAAAAAVPVGTVTYSSAGYTLVFTNKDANFSDATRQNMINTFFNVYPKMRNRFYPGATARVTFVIEPAYGGVAYTSGPTITYSATYMRNRPQDYDVVTHEGMHVVQAYSGGNPGWLVEGIADYARYTYGVNNAGAGWSLPAYSSSQYYTDSYRVTARFLVWLERRVRSSIVNDLNNACRNKTYTSNTWIQLTGKTVDQLWSDYSRNPAL